MPNPLMSDHPANPVARIPPHRWVGLDIARGLAVIAMTLYHLTWDLFSLGLSTINPVSTPALALAAKAIAASFLLLSGIAHHVTHAQGADWNKAIKRSLMIGGAASLVSLGSYLLFPGSWIAFGILHHMALAGVLLPLCVGRSPRFLSLLALLCFLAAELRSDFFNDPLWSFLGLSTRVAPANDYVPLLPWFGFSLIGLAVAPIIWTRMIRQSLPSTHFANTTLAFLGRHSLLYYLLHQPVLLGLLHALLWMGVLTPQPVARPQFTSACVRECSFDQGDEALCRRLCECLYDRLEDQPELLGTPPATLRTDQENTLRQAIKACRQP